MKAKFNLFERVAGLFVLGAIGGAVAASISVAYKKGWFSSKVPFHVTFESAEGLHIGTKVQIAGLRAGAVTAVHLQSNNEVRVRLSVLEKFHDKIRVDSAVQVVRPFIIGEKVIDISVGSQQVAMLDRGAHLRVKSSVDLMDLLSGRQLGQYLNSMTQMTDNMKVLLEAFSDKKRFKALVGSLDEISPMIKNLNAMSRNVVQLSNQLNQDKRIGRLVGNLAQATDELQPHFTTMAEHGPQVAKDMAESLGNLVLISEELKKTLPALSAIAPDLPRTSKRLVEAVDQAVVMMKALQKSWFIRSNVEEVKEEEKKQRMPASE